MNGASDSSRKEILFEAIRMTRLASWIYGKQRFGFPMARPPLEEQVEKVMPIGRADISTQGAAVITQDKIYLVFRGSESLFTRAGLMDWPLNFKFLKRSEYFGIRAHRGFATAAVSVLEEVREILDTYPDKPLVEIGGHSLGGAVATLVAVAVVHWARMASDSRQIKLITLGQPKVSRKRQLNLALRFVPYIRIENGSDAVTRLPRLAYSHGGSCLYLSNKGELQWNPAAVRKLFDRALTIRERVSDHSTKDYLSQLLRHVTH